MRTTKTKTRWEEHSLMAHDRPRKMYEYYVTGRGTFPYDMLRYDSCWPATGVDASKMDTDFLPPAHRLHSRSIKLRSYKTPTIDRWSSFTWSVGTENLEFQDSTTQGVKK